MIKQAPLSFIPYLRPIIWGGDKICKYKGIPSPESNIGESWEICALEGHESVVESGLYAGKSITELIESFGDELLGGRVISRYGRKFPLLIKFIDAARDLSIQIHPDDDIARRRHNCNGKEEMWYIIHTENEAKIYAGLTERLDPEKYLARVAEGTFSQAVAAYDSKPGDVFYIPSGRVHAIGAGNLLAEIQESSDVTYRIYDYGRLDSDGKPRELHTELAKDAIDYTVLDNYRSEVAPADEHDCRIASSRYFTVRRVTVDGPAELKFDSGSFTVMMCVKGSARLSYPAGTMNLNEGHTVLLPAVMSEINVNGAAVMLVSQSV